jgi:hypothetical protein
MKQLRNVELEGGTVRSGNRRAGISLVELMVGVAVLGLVLGTSFGVVMQGLLMLENARDNTRASQILQRR